MTGPVLSPEVQSRLCDAWRNLDVAADMCEHLAATGIDLVEECSRIVYIRNQLRPIIEQHCGSQTQDAAGVA